MRECKQNNNHKIAKIFLEAGIAIGNGWNQFHFPTDLIYMLDTLSIVLLYYNGDS